jgi:hypothetical protein
VLGTWEGKLRWDGGSAMEGYVSRGLAADAGGYVVTARSREMMAERRDREGKASRWRLTRGLSTIDICGRYASLERCDACEAGQVREGGGG